MITSKQVDSQVDETSSHDSPEQKITPMLAWREPMPASQPATTQRPLEKEDGPPIRTEEGTPAPLSALEG